MAADGRHPLVHVQRRFDRDKHVREDCVRYAGHDDDGNDATKDPRAPARRTPRSELAGKLAPGRLVDVVALQTKHAGPFRGTRWAYEVNGSSP